MGVFDTVRVPCPSCGSKVDVQTKTGNNELAWYELDSTSPWMGLGIANEACQCRCGQKFVPRITVSTRIEPVDEWPDDVESRYGVWGEDI
ncbi:MAG: hypothetical protein AAFY46_13885 [Planctomycetota bacterium]